MDFSTGSVGLGVAITAFSSLIQDYLTAHGRLDDQDRVTLAMLDRGLADRDFTAEHVGHQLHAVADAERRHAELEEDGIDVRRALRVDGRRPAREDQRQRVDLRWSGAPQTGLPPVG